MIATTMMAIAFALGILLTPLASEAQPAEKIRQVIFLGPFEPPSDRWEAFRAGMREYGWTEGKNLSTAIRLGALEARHGPALVARWAAIGLRLGA